VDMAVAAGDRVLAPAVGPEVAADLLPLPLQAESSEAPPAAAAHRRNARRPGAWLLPGSPASAMAARLPFAVASATVQV